MDGANLIRISGLSFDSRESEEKYDKWHAGAYAPMLLSAREQGLEHYLLLEETPAYPKIIFLGYYDNLENFLIYSNSPERNAYFKDTQTTWGDKMERRWGVLYQVVRRFKNEAAIPDAGDIDKSHSNVQMKEYTPEKAPVVLLKGLSLSVDEWDKYDTWIREWAYDVYIPMLLKVPGVNEYTRCWLSNVDVGYSGSTPKPGATESVNYPQDLSIIHFENVKAYQNFLKSKELAVFEKNLATEFPSGLTYKWSVAAWLLRRWMK